MSHATRMRQAQAWAGVGVGVDDGRMMKAAVYVCVVCIMKLPAIEASGGFGVW